MELICRLPFVLDLRIMSMQYVQFPAVTEVCAGPYYGHGTSCRAMIVVVLAELRLNRVRRPLTCHKSKSARC